MKGCTYSVVIPVFNRADKLPRAIASVRAAAVLADVCVEIVVIDDASSDGSADKARAMGVDQVVVLSLNEGVTAARNRGIAIATGEWLVLLDSDDELHVDCFNILEKHWQEQPETDIFFGACVDRSGQPMHSIKAQIGIVAFDRLLVYGAGGEFLPVVNQKVFKKISFEAELRGFESVTWLKAARAGYKLHYSDKIVRIYDKSGDDRLCLRKNIVSGSDRLAIGWNYFLGEFGDCLWRLNKFAYILVSFKCGVYEKINASNFSKKRSNPDISGLAPRVVLVVSKWICSVTPASWLKYAIKGR